jgi:hypothetical protein
MGESTGLLMAIDGDFAVTRVTPKLEERDGT